MLLRMPSRPCIRACRAWGKEFAMKHTRLTIIGYIVATWCLLGAFASLAACSRQPRYAAPPIEGEHVVIPAASLPLEMPQFYSFRTEGTDVNFFVIRMKDRVLSFLDACLTCYPRKLGYRYENGAMVCRACDTRYSIHRLEQGIGGCFPIRIAGKLEGGSYLIARSALERHANKF
jgi:uncharacterized membrane protein